MPKPSVKQLKNGISVVLDPQKGAKSATVFVFCRVGSRYESKAISGASHFIEHLMFKGTKRRPNTQIISRELDRFGANFNAMTSKDYTGYYVKIDAAHVPLAMDLLHDMLFHSTYDTKEINRERGVIIEEINMYEDNPKMHIEDLVEASLFPNSTLGWNIAGPKSVIRKVTRAQLIAYRDRYYIPSRLTIALAGKIPANAMALLESTFGKVKQPKRPADAEFKAFCAPRRLNRPLNLQEKKTEQTQVGIAFHGYSLSHRDEPAAKLLSTILGGSMSSRLFIQVRERRGLCYSISSYHQSLEDTGIFGIYAGLDRKRLDEAIRTIKSELRKVKRSGVTAEELKRAKDNLRGKITLAFEDSSFRTGWYGKQRMFEESLKTPEARMRELDRVTRADVKRVANDLFHGKTMAAAVIGPRLKRGALEKIFRLE